MKLKAMLGNLLQDTFQNKVPPFPAALIAMAILTSPIWLVMPVMTAGLAVLGLTTALSGAYGVSHYTNKVQQVTWTNDAGQTISSTRDEQRHLKGLQSFARMTKDDAKERQQFSDLFSDVAQQTKAKVVQDISGGNGKFQFKQPSPAVQ